MIAALLIALAAAQAAWADTLVLSDSHLFGKVVSVGRAGVVFTPACSGQSQTFPTAQVLHIEFNRACLPRPIKDYSGGAEICDEAPLQLYEVSLRGGKTLAAADVAVQDGRVHLRTADGLRTAHGPADKVLAITRRLYCRTSLPPAPPLSAFCVEDTQFAVNFGPEPVFGNRILTRGLSFYLEDEKGRPIRTDDPLGQTIRNGFGTAMTFWMSALQSKINQLPLDIQAGLRPMISTSPRGYTLLTPPQVVQMGCREAASFVIRYVTHNEAGLIVGGEAKAARAEVQGRTLWINGVMYPCWQSSPANSLYLPGSPAGAAAANGCVNLVPILIHELGHAFGLGHRDGVPSIMNSVISPVALAPTPQDADDLVQVLQQQIQGAPAGRLDADALGVAIAPRTDNEPKR